MKQKISTANKEELVAISQQSSLLECCCCMCGDSGVTQELFHCKVCQFRSQHSNLYPKAESYEDCNWCLNQKDDSKEKSQNSSNSSASCKDNSEDQVSKNKKKADNHGAAALNGGERISNLKLQLIKNPIKKPKSAGKLSPSTTRKRIITNGFF